MSWFSKIKKVVDLKKSLESGEDLEWYYKLYPHARKVHELIKEKNPKTRFPSKEEKARGEFSCPECYGYGILRLEREEGPYQWWRCDFCGNVEPTVMVTGITSCNSGTVLRRSKDENCSLPNKGG